MELYLMSPELWSTCILAKLVDLTGFVHPVWPTFDHLIWPPPARSSQPIVLWPLFESCNTTALPPRPLLAEHAHDRLGVTVNDGQQDAGGAVWNTTPLFPILHGTRIETESVRELLATQLHTLPNRKNTLCGRIVDNAAG